MKKRVSMSRLFGVLLIAGSALGGCALPKILINNQYVGEEKIAKYLLLPTGSGGAIGAKGKPQYNVYVRVCDLDKQKGTSTACQDTIVLDSVQLGKLYE